METLVKRNSLLPLIPTTNLIDDLFSRDIFDWTDRNFSSIGSNLPSVNIKETENKLQIDLAAPGMRKEDFKVEIDNNTLLISSERQEEKEESSKKDNFIRKEFNYQSFYRSFALPEYIDENKIKAIYKDGILHLEIAKKEGSQKKTVKNIAIQ
jgi:HSP20 family protein